MTYSLLILLPKPVERELRQWAKVTPGATVPFWGAHVTLFGDFVPTRGIKAIQGAVEEVCAGFCPFTVDLDQVVSPTHLRRPHQKTVFLAGNAGSKDHHKLLRLRRELAAALDRLKRDGQPEVSRRGYYPHLSLTWGLPEDRATELAQAAAAAHLKVEFTVEKIWLLKFTPDSSAPRQVEHVRAFELDC